MIAAPPQARVFALSFFTYYAYVGVFAPYASLYFSGQGMSGVQIGILMSLMQVTRIFGPNLWGWIADRSGQRVRVLRYTAFCALVSLCGFFTLQTFAVFFLVMVLLNTFTSSQAPLAEALMLQEMRGDLTHYGRLRLWGSVGFICAVMLGGLILDRFGVVAFPRLALGLLLLVCLVTLKLQEPAASGTHAEGGIRASSLALLRKPEVLAFFTSTFLMVAAHAALYVYYSLYLERIGYSKSVIGAMWSLGVLAEIVFFYFQAPLFRRFGAKKLMLVSLGLAVLRFSMIAGGATSFAVLLVAQVLHAFTFGSHHSASVMTMQRWFAGPLQARGQALYISISYGLGGSLGGLVLSLGWERISVQSVYWLAALMALLALLAAMLSYHWQKPVSVGQGG
jgi:PPP family 3-phenylpropionic acid transporter